MTSSRTIYFLILAFLALCCTPSHAQTVTSLCTPICQFLDGSGNLLAGGTINTYQAGTTTPLATYTDSTGSVQNANPIVLNSAGMPSNGSSTVGIYLTSSAYKFVAKNSLGATVWTQDGITVFNANSLTNVISAAANPATVGFIRMGNGDLLNWRNIANSANIGFAQAGLATANTGNIADVLQYGDSSHGALQAQAYMDFSAAPAQSGVFRCGSGVSCVVVRNAAGNGDVVAILVDGSNVLNLGGSAGSKFLGPINFNSQTFSGVPSFSVNGALSVNGSSGLPTGTTTNLWFAGGFGTPITGKVYIGDGSGWELDVAKRASSVDTTLFKFQDNGNFSILNSGATFTFGTETVTHHPHFFCSGFSTVIAATNAFQRCYATQGVTIEAIDYNTNSTPGAGCATQPTIDVCYGAGPTCSQQLTMTNGSAIGDSTITAFNIPAATPFAVRVEVGPSGCSTSWTNVSAGATVREQ